MFIKVTIVWGRESDGVSSCTVHVVVTLCQAAPQCCGGRRPAPAYLTSQQPTDSQSQARYTRHSVTWPNQITEKYSSPDLHIQSFLMQYLLVGTPLRPIGSVSIDRNSWTNGGMETSRTFLSGSSLIMLYMIRGHTKLNILRGLQYFFFYFIFRSMEFIDTS